MQARSVGLTAASLARLLALNPSEVPLGIGVTPVTGGAAAGNILFDGSPGTLQESLATITTAGSIIIPSAQTLLFGSDTQIGRGGIAQFRFGLADAASPVGQFFSVQSVVAGTTNTAGAAWTFLDSGGTGTGASGGYKFFVHPAGLTGTAQNAQALALTIDSTLLATFGGGITLPSNATLQAATGSLNIRAGSGGVINILNNGGGAAVQLNGGTFEVVNSGSFNWSSTSGLSTVDLGIARNAAGVLEVNNGTAGAFAFAKAKLQTSVNATTGLAAGVLAALTNATIVVYDGTGQAYRVPCII